MAQVQTYGCTSAKRKFPQRRLLSSVCDPTAFHFSIILVLWWITYLMVAFHFSSHDWSIWESSRREEPIMLFTDIPSSLQSNWQTEHRYLSALVNCTGSHKQSCDPKLIVFLFIKIHVLSNAVMLLKIFKLPGYHCSQSTLVACDQPSQAWLWMAQYIAPCLDFWMKTLSHVLTPLFFHWPDCKSRSKIPSFSVLCQFLLMGLQKDEIWEWGQKY